MTATDIRHRAGLKEWMGLAVLALPTLLLSLDITVLHLAVPELSADLRPSNTQTLWIIDIYGFMIAGFLVTMGTLGDRIGRRRLLLGGAAAFGAASAVAAYASSPEALIAARTLLGIAGATLMPSTLSLISNMFRDARQRGLAIGIWATMFSAGIAIGPVAGGALLDHFWWGSVFLLGVPVMVLLLAAGPFLLPEFRDTKAGRPDLASVALSLVTMLAITYGIKELPKHGPGLLPMLTIGIGIAAGVVFVRRQRRLADPLLDVSLFADRAFSGALVSLLVSTGMVGGAYLFITQYLQLVQDLSPLRAGLWLLPAAVALIIASLAAPIIARRVRPAYVIGAALAVSTLGYALLTQVDAEAGLPLLVAGFVLVYIGTGPTTALGTDLVVGSAPPEKAGAASALGETSTELGVALGVAGLGSLGTAAYRDQMPADAPAAVRDTLAGAVAAGTDGALLTTAREAFTTGLTTAATAGAVLTAAVAVLAVLTLRQVRPAGDPATQAPEPPPPEGALTLSGGEHPTETA
ncbi:MFS transporter [Actinomadura sp. KC216]|uniref:MFS transporter n=1 Tax=Actinomadura sp. KC216 TaxID=2530370 RepID=UPI0010429273|nr:MFS transporter [Actinomadura sp. KC216]TDB81305.1 MFS transporter [Actinomadura sp. KC216]